jgi:hypothetical protein
LGRAHARRRHCGCGRSPGSRLHLRDRTNAKGLIAAIGVSDPGQAVAAEFDEQSTDVGEQGRLVAGTDQRLIAFAQSAQGAMASPQRLVRLFALADVTDEALVVALAFDCKGAGTDLDRKAGPVATLVNGLEEDSVGFCRSLPLLFERAESFLAAQVADKHATQLVGAVAVSGDSRCVGFDDLAILVDQQNDVARLADHRLVVAGECQVFCALLVDELLSAQRLGLCLPKRLGKAQTLLLMEHDAQEDDREQCGGDAQRDPEEIARSGLLPPGHLAHRRGADDQDQQRQCHHRQQQPSTAATVRGRRGAFRQAPQQGVQQHRSQPDEGQAFEHAERHQRLRLHPQASDQGVGKKDPEGGDEGIDEYHAQHRRAAIRLHRRHHGTACMPSGTHCCATPRQAAWPDSW